MANPSFPGGGFVGESKAEILQLAMRHMPDRDQVDSPVKAALWGVAFLAGGALMC